MERKEFSKATAPVEEPKKPHFTLNHWTVGIALIGLLMSCSPSLTFFGIGVISLGVGLFVVTMTRKLWLGIPFFFIFLAAAFYWHTHNPSMGMYQKKAYGAAANADAKNAYIAAQAYFIDYPTGTISLSKLTSYGFVQSSNVTLTVILGKKSDLQITSSHSSGTETYTINSSGEISF
ncbi:MAG: hypothetical protein JRJ41_01025 [Deltaproteobacteria bacterium]|nr:hypothetical protein [Deltaproteobacteria bacterium]